MVFSYVLEWQSSTQPPLFRQFQGEVRRISLPRTRLNKAGTAVPSLRLLALANRVVERRPPYINSEGA